MSTIGNRIQTAARVLRVALGLCLALGITSGCKQGEGEVCQLDTDCEDGLTCSTGSNRCESTTGTTPRADAAPAIDAPTSQSDAPPADAAPSDATEGTADASPPLPDAAVAESDAGTPLR